MRLLSEKFARTKFLDVFWWPFSFLRGRTMRTSHNLLELSFELLSSSVPLEFISTEVTSPKCDAIVRMHRPETISQNLIVLSFEPLIIRLPRGLNIVLDTASWCPWNVFTTAPVFTSNNRTVLSYPPVTRLVSLRWYWTEYTSPPWPANVETQFALLLFKSQICHVELYQRLPTTW